MSKNLDKSLCDEFIEITNNGDLNNRLCPCCLTRGFVSRTKSFGHNYQYACPICDAVFVGRKNDKTAGLLSITQVPNQSKS